MIKATDIVNEDIRSTDEREVRVSLVADTKEEVITNGDSGSGVFGLMDTDVMTLGSTCLCATGDFGILNSDGEWNF